MDIKYLKEFIVFSEHMNFSAASRELYLAQPTLSQHLAALEEEVGVLLIDRSNPQLRLTEAGELFADKAQEIINLYDTTLRECQDASKKRTLIRVQDHRKDIAFEQYFDRATKFLNTNNHSKVFVIQYIPIERNPIEETLKKGAVDICFVFSAQGMQDEINALKKKGFEGFLIYNEPCHVYCSSDNELAKNENLTLDDISGRAFLAMRHPAFSSFRRAVHDTFASLGVELSHQLFSAESIFDHGTLQDNRFIIFDSERDFTERLEQFSTEMKIVQRDIEGKELGLDVYVVFDPVAVNPTTKEWLSALQDVVTK